MNITKALREWLIANDGLPSTASDRMAEERAKAAVASGKLTASKLAELTGDADGGGDHILKLAKAIGAELRGGGTATVSKLYGLSAGTVRIKGEKERYDATRPVLKHTRTGMPVEVNGREAVGASELDLAKAGAYFRAKMLAEGVSCRPLSDHEKGLLADMVENDEWSGEHAGQWVEDVSLRSLGYDVKAPILNDLVSGGAHLVPEAFDRVVVTYPLLTGELFPHVTLLETNRDRVTGAAMGNPTLTWGTPENTAMPLFDATGLFAPISTVIHPLTFAVEIGRDFLSDAAVDVGALLKTQLGQAYLAEMDFVIAVGDGVIQPLGLFNTPELAVVPSVSAEGPITRADEENLIFGLSKAYRSNGRNPSFVGNDLNYQRFRTIRAAADSNMYATPGPGLQDYRINGYPYRVQNSILNTDVFFGDLRSYRMYRRKGFSIETSTEGKDLMLRNMLLLVARGRFGGRYVDPNAGVIMQDAPI